MNMLVPINPITAADYPTSGDAVAPILPAPSMVTETPEQQRAARKRKAIAERDAREAYVQAKFLVIIAAQALLKIEHIDPLYREQANMLIGLSRWTPHRIRGGSEIADSVDARAIRDDLELLARVVDPMIAGIGERLARNFHGVDRAQFDRQLDGALVGQAMFECEAAAERADDEQRISNESVCHE